VSALAGIYARDGGPADHGMLARVGRGLASMGPDNETVAHSASVAMLFRPFHTDAESRVSPQPAAAADGTLLCFDGRLDNAAELAKVLCASTSPAPRAIDIVLSAYREWGTGAFGRLIGDFALALWDAPARRLLLCADAMGRRPLYYNLTPGRVAWSSRCRPLLRGVGLPVRIDEEYVAEFLANRPTTHSPFCGISLVPGAHVLIVHADRHELHRYWAFDTGHTVRYGSDLEYEEHFSELFEEAVACRARADAPVFAELSGGLDSSTVVAAARERAIRSPEEIAEIKTVSYVFDGARGSDERPFIHLAEEQFGGRGLYLSERDHPLLLPVPHGFEPDLPTNQLFYLARHDRLAREMAKTGSRVILSGIGGDQMFWSEPPPGLPLADHLARGRVRDLARECGAWSRATRWPYHRMLWKGAIRPLLPRRVLAGTRRRVGEWVNPAFAHRMQLWERHLGIPDDLGFAVPSTAMQYGSMRQTMRIFALERCLTDGYVDMRYPYLDRRLIEFSLAIPLEQKVRPHECRSIVRRAFRGRLPEALRNRTSKSGPTEALHRALIREWPRLSRIFADPIVADLGFVDRTGIMSALTRLRHGLVSSPVLLHRTLSLELWLRTLDGTTPMPVAQRRKSTPHREERVLIA
jgi:asparagine synthase (glutamine-hydrolysing)